MKKKSQIVLLGMFTLFAFIFTKSTHAYSWEKDSLHYSPDFKNVDVILKRVEGALERGKMNLGSVYIKTTMGPSERIV